MLDDRSSSFLLRRPLLIHVAEHLQEEIAEWLSDESISGRTNFEVMTAAEFANLASTFESPLIELPSQVMGVVQVYNIDHVTRIESTIRDLLTIHESHWTNSEIVGPPILNLICLIPPHVMPEGWRARNDVPRTFGLKIETVDPPATTQAKGNLRLISAEPNQPFPLIMKGGGIKGLAYVGSLQELYKYYKFNWFVGTSAGAITAVLLGAGYTPDELHELMTTKDFRDFFDAPWYMVPVNLLTLRGCYRADALTNWLDGLLARKLSSPTRVRLSQLPHRVTVYACRRGNSARRFDSKDADADAAYAARCSMSIPYVFVPQQDQGFRTFDGGLHQNYPVDQFLISNPNTSFISLYLGPEYYEPPLQRFVFWDLVSIMTEGSDAESVAKYRKQTVIIDPQPIGTLDFDLTNDEKQLLLLCGRVGALAHIDNESREYEAAQQERDALRQSVNSARIAASRLKRKRRRWAAAWIMLCVMAIVASRFLF